jgi:hypothetical protein
MIPCDQDALYGKQRNIFRRRRELAATTTYGVSLPRGAVFLSDVA